MKRVTNIFVEPIVITLLHRGDRRSFENLLVDESRDLEDSEISPELENMESKGRVSIESIEGLDEHDDGSEVVEDSVPAVVEEVEISPEETEALERELLGDDEESTDEDLDEEDGD